MKIDLITFGAQSSSKTLIYFHGLDELESSPQELANRTVLERVAREGWYIVCLRSQWMRKNGQLHWPREAGANRDETLKTLQAISNDRKTSEGHRIFGALGFSNGGYFVSRLWLEGLADLFDFVIAFGCGLDDLPVMKEHTTPLFLVVGDKDIHHAEQAREASQRLSHRNVPHVFKSFSGEHCLAFDPLVALLSDKITDAISLPI